MIWVRLTTTGGFDVQEPEPFGDNQPDALMRRITQMVKDLEPGNRIEIEMTEER